MCAALLGRAIDRKVARQHALDVAIEYGLAAASRQRLDGGSGGAADARQLGEQLARIGQLAAVLADDALRGAMQVARARVIPEPRPQVQHRVERGGGQRCDIREAVHEALVIGDYGRNLGLLQHDLRDPDPIRRGLVLPRQCVAAVTRVPGDQCLGDAARHLSSSGRR